MSRERTPRKLTAILYADAVGYSRLMAADEIGTLRLLGEYRAVLSDEIRLYGGRVVDAPGDNLLADFPSVLDAVQCAVAIQEALAQRNARLPEERRMPFRIGVHSGDVVVEGDRIYGDGVNIAARLEGLAQPGGVCVSGTAHDQIEGKLALRFESAGEQAVKNIPRRIRVYRVRPPGEPPAAAGHRGGQRRRRLPIVAAAVVLAIGLGLALSWPRPLGWLVVAMGAAEPPANPSLPDRPSIVVLPFANLSGDSAQEYFSDGITDQVTADLARDPSLFVISRNSAFLYKGKAVNLGDVGRELGVRYVLEGSVRKADERVRITAQLIDATTDHHIWSEQYDAELADIFALQSRVSQEISTALGSNVIRAEQQRARALPTRDLNYYEAITRGHFHLNRRSRKDNAEARRWFERALELEPEHAWAYSGLGGTYLAEHANGWDGLDPASLDRGEELVRRALELDPFDADAHSGLATVYLQRGRPREAHDAAARAAELVPSWESYQALLGVTLAQQGRLVPAIQAIKRAMRLNPRAPTDVLMSVAYVNLAAGRRQEAAALLERVRLSSPDNILVRVGLAALYQYEGRNEEARAAVEEALLVNPDLTVEIAARLVPGRHEILAEEEAAQLEATLRKAGLPSGRREE